MLEVKNISSGYGKKQVLFNVSFEVKQGEIVLLTGGNGSGKSTILKCIYGLLPLWSGEIFFKGKNLAVHKTSDLIKKGIIYIPQKNNYFENLTVQENLEVSGSIYHKHVIKEKIEKVYTEIPKLAGFKKRTPFNLSGGERQLLAFGLALIHEPKLILFDEPTSGIDKNNTSKIISLLYNMKKIYGLTFIIVEHRNTITIRNKTTLVLELGELIK